MPAPTVRTIDDAPFVDVLSDEFRNDAEGVINGLRDQSWLIGSFIGGMVIDRAHVQALLADRRLRSSLREFIEMQGVTSGLLHERMTATLLAIEGKDHSRVRTLVRKAFVPAAIDRYRPMMRSILESLLTPLLDSTDGRVEFMTTIAEHYPIQVMCHILGVPTEDHEDFTCWINAIAWVLSLDLAAHRDSAEAGMQALDDYTTSLIADRRASPRDDLVTELVQAEEAGDRLSDVELRSLIIGLLFAGYDTTRNQLGQAMVAFAENPDQWRLIGERPQLVPQAVEEVLRYRGSVATAPRLVAEDFEYDGYRFTKGQFLSLSTASANHDPAAFHDPERFDITAQREPQLTFGGGPHYCLGAGLARAELQEAFVVLSSAISSIGLDGEVEWRPPTGIMGPAKLPLRFERVSA